MPNLSPAMGYGKFHFIFNSGDQPWCDPDGAMDHAHEVLQDFDPAHDYLLYPNSGDPAGMWAILLVLSRLDISKVTCLYWERKFENGERSKTDGFYSPVTFNLAL
jgi:hypothetical protein